ncbi:hypothetical protein [Streptomyces sp. NPDC047315]|uniref:hypothetical protein n=1 Tax=Streptomyces sp. NPDC047315 TaxID=3155142 RepID=UPI0033E42C49
MYGEPPYTPDAEAEEAPPWREDFGLPGPDVLVYPPGQQPTLWVYTQGGWKRAHVHARQTYRDRTYAGRVAYQVELQLTGEDGIIGTYARSYWWGQPAVAAQVWA